MATNGATGAAISSHGVLPRLVSKKEGRIVSPISNPIEVVGIARTRFDIRVPPRPISCPVKRPTRDSTVVFCPRLRTIGDYMLVDWPLREKGAI